VTDEPEITGVLIGQLDAQLEGQIGGLHWSTKILRHGGGVAAEEKKIGPDLLIHISFQASQLRYSKGVLIQAKRVEPYQELTPAKHAELVKQCKKMLRVTPAAFVFDYSTRDVRCGSATAIAGSADRHLYAECPWTSYRFFLELFRCPVGDPNITSARVERLPVPNVVTMRVTGD
jgi:hypothetical protein